ARIDTDADTDADASREATGLFTNGARSGASIPMATTDTTGRARNRSGPFAGVLIADLTHALSGPFCTMLLAELGARVVTVERPPSGDLARAFSPMVDGQSVFFTAVNRGKESIALDLDCHPDRELFVNLVRRADVVVENFRPGTLEHHGCGYDALRAIN